MVSTDDPRAAIVHALMHAEMPMGLYQIMKESGISIQTVDYWVGKMVDEGVLVVNEEGEQRRYLLQPLFYDKVFSNQFNTSFEKLYKLVRNKLISVEEKNKKGTAFSVLLSILHHMDMHIDD